MAYGDHCRIGIADGAYDLQIGLELEQRSQPVAQDGVILHDEKALLRSARRRRSPRVKPVVRGRVRRSGLVVSGTSQSVIPCYRVHRLSPTHNQTGAADTAAN